ncbi:MAG: RluA family pseudouridine synthase [Oscillospiraceae bacterium]|nr:RluA family pseudouridine synthase [Oscillospiraceae bacterium]
MKTITLECDNGGERLDVFLADNISGLTRSAAQKLLEAERVALYGKNTDINKNRIIGAVTLRKNYKTITGDVYTVIQDEPELSVVITQDIPLDIIYEDTDLIVVNKPRGMVVHPAPGHSDGTLVNALLHHCGDSLSGIGGVIRPGIVHRIDKDTSGLIIAAKNDRAHLSLASQLSSRTLTREYDAIVCGNVKNESGTIDAPIGRHPTDRKKQAVYTLHSEKRSRPAITHYTVVARFGGYTHIRCRLETGRTHQIRVHMAYVGYPILGDIVYGRKKPELGMSSQCLHARKLCFTHPSTNERIKLYAELPDYFTDVLTKLEKKA